MHKWTCVGCLLLVLYILYCRKKADLFSICDFFLLSFKILPKIWGYSAKAFAGTIRQFTWTKGEENLSVNCSILSSLIYGSSTCWLNGPRKLLEPEIVHLDVERLLKGLHTRTRFPVFLCLWVLAKFLDPWPRKHPTCMFKWRSKADQTSNLQTLLMAFNFCPEMIQ